MAEHISVEKAIAKAADRLHGESGELHQQYLDQSGNHPGRKDGLEYKDSYRSPGPPLSTTFELNGQHTPGAPLPSRKSGPEVHDSLANGMSPGRDSGSFEMQHKGSTKK